MSTITTECGHSDDPLLAALAEHFGFKAFQAGQRPVIEDVLAGRPTMAVMPTGAGKSLCYQLPALMLDGVTVVVSPLIALMKDQVDALKARGVAADFVNSSQSRETQREVLARLAAGQLDLVYVAPERFRHGAFVRALTEVPLALFAVDEAHCISRWGHDFRPDYTRLGDVVDRLRPARLLACTATATPEVRADICRALRLDEPAIHVAGFLRPNLFLEARRCTSERDREARLLRFLESDIVKTGAIIIYASTRKRVERYAKVVMGVLGEDQVVYYHGGLGDEARNEAQDRFMSKEVRVAVATNAFGMGVDRSDVRAVVHIDLPRTVEGYYQEVGRAGRDGDPAHCLLLHNPIDTRVHVFLIDKGHAPPKAIEILWGALHGEPDGLRQGKLASILSKQGIECDVEVAIRQLFRVDAVQFNGANYRAAPGAPADVYALGIDFDSIARHYEHEHGKLRRMQGFIRGSGCRHANILEYFSEPFTGKCPGCDRCSKGGIAGTAGVERGTPTEVEGIAIRKALAGVARADGRFGARKVADMLAGSRAKSIANSSLVNLSTYGILRNLGSERCSELLQLLVEEGLCEMSSGKYPLLQITPDGWEIMQGRVEAEFRPPKHLVPGNAPARPQQRSRAPSPVIDDADLDPAVIDLLKVFRRAAAEERGVPSYVVFSDRSLRAIAAKPPTDKASFTALHGLGPKRWSQFGSALVAALQPKIV